MNWKLPFMLLLAGAPAAAQPPGCVRDGSGQLQCTTPRLGAPRTVTPLRPIARADLSRDAATRSNILMEQRREAMEGQRREADEQRARLRQDCRDRAAASPDTTFVCGH
jgi:hypothetical protein